MSEADSRARSRPLTLLFELGLRRLADDGPNGPQAAEQPLEEAHLRRRAAALVAELHRAGRVAVVPNRARRAAREHDIHSLSHWG